MVRIHGQHNTHVAAYLVDEILERSPRLNSTSTLIRGPLLLEWCQQRLQLIGCPDAWHIATTQQQVDALQEFRLHHVVVFQEENCVLPFDARHLSDLLEIPLPILVVVLPRRRGVEIKDCESLQVGDERHQ